VKNSVTIFVAFIFIIMACNQQPAEKDNPFYADYGTPFGVPPFEKIETSHFMPAFKAGMEEQQEEIKAIVDNPAEPTFGNTIVELEYSGALLDKVNNVFFNLTSSYTNDSIQSIAKEISPMLSSHSDDIYLNEKLFQRVKTIHDNKEKLSLTPEQEMLLEKKHNRFVRGGANLDDEAKEKLRAINEELSVLSLEFRNNLLKENNNYRLVIEDEQNLSGLTEGIIAGAAETAEDLGMEGKWVFTLDKPSFIPFLQYADKRELREEIFKAYTNRGNNDNEYDNKDIAAKIAALRVERANLLGYETHADYVLENRMAESPAEVQQFLDNIMKKALPVAKEEAAALQQMIDESGEDFDLQAWDWWYYAEKLRKQKYDLDEENLRPYFKLENVRKGAFEVANKLWGLNFKERDDIPVYQEDVQVFEVMDNENKHVGILYMDFFPRSSKRTGAWMNSFRKQYRMGEDDITPIVTTNFNFSKPTGNKPALLSMDEAMTLFHEFGHALHGLLSDGRYPSLTGTSVYRDFVELPSQIMENWAGHPDVIKLYAKHYETGEVIPEEMLAKLEESKYFNQGFVTVEYMAASILDMDWHTLKEPKQKDVIEFENQSLENMGMIPQIVVRYRSPYFAHIFSSGYSAGYYSYIWAEVLDSDAFEAFKENGLFDKETAESFRNNILSKGGTEDPMVLYKKFRGKEPSIDPLLMKRGLIERKKTPVL